MNDRDHFAAAALTGLTACGDYSVESTPVLAYRMADAMLRQRANHIPDAAHPRNGAVEEPVAWAVVSDSTEEIDWEFIYTDAATAGDVALDSNGGVVPLYRQPQPTLTDAEREAVEIAVEYVGSAFQVEHYAATLRGLLERTK